MKRLSRKNLNGLMEWMMSLFISMTFTTDII